MLMFLVYDRPFILHLKFTSILNFVTPLVRGHLQKVPNRKRLRNMFFTLFEVQLRTCAITFIMHKVCVSANWKPWLLRWWWSIISVADGWEWDIGTLIYSQFLLVMPFSTFFRYPASNPAECEFHKKLQLFGNKWHHACQNRGIPLLQYRPAFQIFR